MNSVTPLPPGPTGLRLDSVTRFLDSRKNRISPNYLRDSGTVLRAWAQDALQGDSTRLCDVTAQSIQSYLGSLSVKPATFAAYAFTLKQFFTWCIANGL